MFGTLGGPEILLLLVLALIVFGPRKLPEIGKSMGRMLSEFRRASNDFRRTIEDEVEAEKMRVAINEEPTSTTAGPPPAPPISEADTAPLDPSLAPPAAADAAPAGEAARSEPATAPLLAPPDQSVSRDSRS